MVVQLKILGNALDELAWLDNNVAMFLEAFREDVGSTKEGDRTVWNIDVLPFDFVFRALDAMRASGKIEVQEFC